MAHPCTSCNSPVPDDAVFCPSCGAPTPTRLSQEFGDDFEPRLKTALQDRYRIERELGRGSMAVVHRRQGWGQAREST
ncbi:MAG: zinc-ribbon domain-containing protein [Gemmatimonadota bacterium]|nr:MAG: zinc-ribbon domain-containing protein [Gemmatimonadota bacterium]